MIKDDNGIVPRNSRVSSITQTGELLFVIRGRISSSTVSHNTEWTSVRTTVSIDFFLFVTQFQQVVQAYFTYQFIVGIYDGKYCYILRTHFTNQDFGTFFFFRRATNGLSIIKDEAVIILLLSTFSTKRAT